MGLDIYAGTLTRYYSKNWKTVVQQFAERNGLSYSTVYAKPQGEELPVNIIQDDMRQWSSKTSDALAAYYNSAFTPWDENNEKDYFTDKPDWPAFRALMLYVASVKYRQRIPLRVNKDYDYPKDPIVLRALEDETFGLPLLKTTQWWLPFDDVFYFSYQTPDGRELDMATTGALLDDLRRINELCWGADEATIMEWQKTEGYPTDAEVKKGLFKKIAKNDKYDVQSLAKFAFSIFYHATFFSKKNRVPILMDY